jgi:hypothetical protein
MEIDEAMTIVQEAEEVEEDIEEQLTHLEDYDNETQLNLLKREISHIVFHDIQPSEGWFDERWQNIYNYSKIDWSGLAIQYKNNDDYIHNTASLIVNLLRELLEDRCTHPNFPLVTYQSLIHSVHSIWHYYSANYVGGEIDDDMNDLISGLKGL